MSSWNYLHSLIFLTVLWGQEATAASLGCSLNSTIVSVLESLQKTTAQLIVVQKALPTEQSARNKPVDCAEIYQHGHQASGVYRVWPESYSSSGSFNVYCDMTTDGGGWTVIQRRGDFGNPKDYFFKSWNDYKVGFGTLTKDHWLGNDRIFALTDQDEYTIRFDLKTVENETGFAMYNTFWIESEDYGYIMHAGGYTGDVGDSFGGTNGYKFTTMDRDNDVHPEGNCADMYKGGWWYSKCHSSNLNGLYHLGNHSTYADGINWKTWKGYHYSLKDIEMKIKPKNRACQLL